MDHDTLRSQLEWNRAYRPEWDDSPDEYVANSVVGWARSKRLGLYRSGPAKAYVGVQHVDPSLASWAIVDAPEARFFVSIFFNGRVLTLRTFPTMYNALAFLASTLDSFPR